MMAMPGESLDYTLVIPRNHLPGLNWYHTHPHGESHQQVLDGMSGALVIEGIERYAPEVRGLRERVLVIRGMDIGHDPRASVLRGRVQAELRGCGADECGGPSIHRQRRRCGRRSAIAPGRAAALAHRQCGCRHAGMDVRDTTGQHARGGRAATACRSAYHDSPTVRARRVGPSSAGPAWLAASSAIVTGITAQGMALAPRCGRGVWTRGRPAMPNSRKWCPRGHSRGRGVATADHQRQPRRSPGLRAAAVRPSSDVILAVAPADAATAPHFVPPRLSEDHARVLHQRGGIRPPMDARPMVTSRDIGGLPASAHRQRARDELHPMHIHQVHFLAFLENDRPLPEPQWLDTV